MIQAMQNVTSSCDFQTNYFPFYTVGFSCVGIAKGYLYYLAFDAPSPIESGFGNHLGVHKYAFFGSVMGAGTGYVFDFVATFVDDFFRAKRCS